MAAVTLAAGAAAVTFAAGTAAVTLAAGAEAFAVRKRATPPWFTAWAAVVGTAVGVAVAGAVLVHPAKQAAINRITNTVEINPACTSLLKITPE